MYFTVTFSKFDILHVGTVEHTGMVEPWSFSVLPWPEITSHVCFSKTIYLFRDRTQAVVKLWNVRNWHEARSILSMNIKPVCHTNKVQAMRHRPGQAVRASGSWVFQNFWAVGTWMWLSCQLHASAAFISPVPKRYPWYSIHLEAESTPMAIARQRLELISNN